MSFIVQRIAAWGFLQRIAAWGFLQRIAAWFFLRKTPTRMHLNGFEVAVVMRVHTPNHRPFAPLLQVCHSLFPS